ncbi:MAG TPA: putative inorganic carbon transporter subunit DabA [Myxococcota bacterium]|nr:putative inorganic carbon transporter subunit DabA [Myxococcota bacterium]
MTAHAHDEPFCLTCEMARIAPLLPRQPPIKDFIHQNILQVFIDQPFDNALLHAAKTFKARPYMDLTYYRDRFADGAITEQALALAVKSNFAVEDDDDLRVLNHALFHYLAIFDETTLQFLAKQKSSNRDRFALAIAAANELPDSSTKEAPTLRHLISLQLNTKIDHVVNALLFRLIGSYIDQGVSLWPYLDRFDSFLSAVRHLAAHSHVRLAYFVRNADFLDDISGPYTACAVNLLKRLFADPALYQDYIRESLLHHPGWSGMVNVISRDAKVLPKKQRIDLESMFIVKTALEWQLIKHRVSTWKPISLDDVAHATSQRESDPSRFSLIYFLATLPRHLFTPRTALLKSISLVSLQKTWAEALENSYYGSVAETFSARKEGLADHRPPKFQAIFCLDDREFSFATHLEKESPETETFGFPGFFNIDCFFRPYNNQALLKLCPVHLEPKHVVMEEIKGKKKRREQRPVLELASFIARHGANSIVLGFVSAYTLGHLSLFRLLLSFFHPLKIMQAKQLMAKEETTSLVFQHSDASSRFDDLIVGYTADELAERLFTALRSMGLTKDFARLVFVFGHGSSSVNNPHFAAYDCGACAGKPGAINARVFAAMANSQEVRARVQEMGIVIPHNTVFVGGCHDTTTDHVEFFDLAQLPEEILPQVLEFSDHISRASGTNAVERCRAFAIVAPSTSPKTALLEAQHRARALFEPRPELGHTNASLCFIGRKSLIYQKDFQRRAFYQSYDSTLDRDGRTLSSILNAAIPVCGGINLDYYFSRLDPAIYGCGTKLSHNVCSLVGVGNGLDDDLRTGLPIQMTELHDPIRLLIVIEQDQDVILAAIAAQPDLTPWVKNAWVKIASISDQDRQVRMLQRSPGGR